MDKIAVFLLALILSSCARQKETASVTDEIKPTGTQKGLSDEELMETVQRQTFRFFWHGAHPNSGMALERSNTVKAEYYWDFINEAEGVPNFSKRDFGPDACAVGGTGFGIMSTIVAAERKWITREAAVERLMKIADFLCTADCFHGIYPHFMDGNTGKTIPFDRLDDAADLVETSYLLMGFLCAKEYFNHPQEPKEVYLANRIDAMWRKANWNWHTKDDSNYLYWHWSPNNGFDMNFPIWGWNEALITYLMSASSPTHPISKKSYNWSWTGAPTHKNGKAYYGYTLPLGNFEMGGPLFFEQYTFMGIDPNGLTDSLGNDYFIQGKNHTLIQRAYCAENPRKFKGYSSKCWGLTAGDSHKGYVAHCPGQDKGVIQPTAAISSMPYTPQESLEAMRYFYEELGDKIWSDYGFTDGFSLHHDWYAKSHIAIDQGPIIVMIENYRTGLLWKLFMNIPDVQRGLKRLGFKSHYIKE